MEYANIIYTVDNGIATIQLNRSLFNNTPTSEIYTGSECDRDTGS